MKRHEWIAMLSAVLLVAGLVGSVWAADQSSTGAPGQPVPRMMCRDRFDAMDTNLDGLVTKEEFMSVGHPGGRGQAVFQSRDTNGDGVLTKDEFCAGKGKGGRGTP
jgi:EF-hand domain pair